MHLWDLRENFCCEKPGMGPESQIEKYNSIVPPLLGLKEEETLGIRK
jgi:hypothetical protein